MQGPPEMVDSEIWASSASTLPGGVERPADVVRLCNEEGPPTDLSWLHDSCGLVNLPVPPV